MNTKNVYLSLTSEEKEEVIRFWRDENAVLDPEEAQKRVDELVFLVRDDEGHIIAVNTAAIIKAGVELKYFYYYRIFIARQARGSRLVFELSEKTRFFLKDYKHPDGKVEGIIVVTENRKMMRPGMRKVMIKRGYIYQGRDKENRDVWVWPFNN